MGSLLPLPPPRVITKVGSAAEALALSPPPAKGGTRTPHRSHGPAGGGGGADSGGCRAEHPSLPPPPAGGAGEGGTAAATPHPPTPILPPPRPLCPLAHTPARPGPARLPLPAGLTCRSPRRARTRPRTARRRRPWSGRG